MNLKTISKIYIIESQSQFELDNNIAESPTLTRFLESREISCFSITVSDITSFSSALAEIAIDIKKNQINLGAATLHLSLHGCIKGIWLMKTHFISWEELATIIADFNIKIGFAQFANKPVFSGLILCFSVCHGLFARYMHLYTDTPLYMYLIGPNESVNWADSLKAFQTLYETHIVEENNLIESIRKCETTIGKKIFKVELGKNIEYEAEYTST